MVALLVFVTNIIIRLFIFGTLSEAMLFFVDLRILYTVTYVLNEDLSMVLKTMLGGCIWQNV